MSRYTPGQESGSLDDRRGWGMSNRQAAAILGVSEATIRRDLKALAAEHAANDRRYRETAGSRAAKKLGCGK